MKNEQMISNLYRVIGLLEGMTMLQNIMFSESVASVLNECVDNLELIGAQLLAEDVKSREGTEKAARAEDTDQ